MAAYKYLALFALVALVACTHAVDEEMDRTKKDLAPGMMVMMTSQDDGSYYPGKYEKMTYSTPYQPAASAMPYAAVSSYHPAMMPYHGMHAYHAMPAYHGMSAYPYAYGHMPITKVY